MGIINKISEIFRKKSSNPTIYPPVLFAYFSPMFPKSRQIIHAEHESWQKSCRDEFGMPDATVILVSDNEWEYPIQSVAQDDLYKYQDKILDAITSNMIRRGADRSYTNKAIHNIRLIESSIGLSKKMVFIFPYEGKFPFSK